MVKRSPFFALSSCFFIGPKSKSDTAIKITIRIVRNAYRLYGMVLMKSEIPFTPSTVPLTAAAHEDIGAMMQMGAAVESIRYASFERDTLCLSVTGRMTEPTVRQLK